MAQSPALILGPRRTQTVTSHQKAAPLMTVIVTLEILGKIVFAKAGRGTWGLCYTFDGNLYLTRDLMEGSFVPKDLKVPKVKDVPAAPPKKAKKAAKPSFISLELGRVLPICLNKKVQH